MSRKPLTPKLESVPADDAKATEKPPRMNEVRATIYRNGKVINRGALAASMPQDAESAFIWIELLNPQDSDFAVLQGRFRLHSLAVADSMSPAKLPKLDVYEDQIFTVLKTARLEDDEIKYADIDAFLSAHHIITVCHDDMADHVPAHERFEGAPESMRLRPDSILYATMDFVVNSYFPIVQMMEDEVLSMEHRLLDEFLSRDEVNRLFRLRREAIGFQHVVTRMSDVSGKLTNLDVPCIGADVKPYFRDVHDQLQRVDAMIGGLVDVIRAVFEASNLLEQQRQGVTTRQLAAWAAILGVPAAIAEVYGMDFPSSPELAQYGFALVALVMLSSCVALYIRFKKLRWL